MPACHRWRTQFKHQTAAPRPSTPARRAVGEEHGSGLAGAAEPPRRRSRPTCCSSAVARRAQLNQLPSLPGGGRAHCWSVASRRSSEYRRSTDKDRQGRSTWERWRRRCGEIPPGGGVSPVGAMRLGDLSRRRATLPSCKPLSCVPWLLEASEGSPFFTRWVTTWVIHLPHRPGRRVRAPAPPPARGPGDRRGVVTAR